MSFTLQFKSKLKAYFIKKIGSSDYKHGWMKSDCPFCNKELKYGVNISRNRTNCFVCGYKKPPIEVVKELENFDTMQQVYKLLESGNFDDFEFREEKIELRGHKEGFQLPEGFKLLDDGNSQLAKSCRSYIKGRGFSINRMASKGWGYCSNNPEMFGYVIIPFYIEGKLVYYNARNFMSYGPRYNNPNIDDSGVGKSALWYNRDALFMYKQVYVTEGAFNAETLGDMAIASGGKHISRYQLNDVIKSPVERLIIVLDPDAKDKAINLALSLVDFKKVKVIFLPDGEDPNSLGKRKTMKLVYQSRYLNRQQIIQLKNNL